MSSSSSSFSSFFSKKIIFFHQNNPSFLIPQITNPFISFRTQFLIFKTNTPLIFWYDRSTNFCSLPPSANVNIACEFNSVTRLEIKGDRPSIQVTDFHGFSIPNQTLSDAFSMDSFVTTLSRLPSLKVLSLVSLGIWDSLPDKIHRLSSFEPLDLSSNFLFGSIPHKLSTMVKLQTLVFDHNFFNDTVPNMFGSLSNPTSLSLKNNRLKGPFPFSITGITSLINLAFSSNEISGKLPDLTSLGVFVLKIKNWVLNERNGFVMWGMRNGGLFWWKGMIFLGKKEEKDEEDDDMASQMTRGHLLTVQWLYN